MENINFVISGTIEGEYDFPNDLFAGFCYEGWGNAWSLIDGISVKYIPAKVLLNEPNRFSDIDILIAEFGQYELHALASQHGIFNIATESGAGFDIDRANSGEEKRSFIDKLNHCKLFLSTTHAGKSYISMFTTIPILDIPLPMDLDKFRPRSIDKYEKFTVCVGEIIESCYDDRPLQLEAIAIANSIGMQIASSIGRQSRNFGEEDLKQFGFDIVLNPHIGLYEMSIDYLAKSHASIMLGQRSTFGRFVYVSWAIGVPCIATRYQCQERICPELTVGCEEISKIRDLLARLRDDRVFYDEIRKKGLNNVRNILSKENIALRIVNEILPIYFANK